MPDPTAASEAVSRAISSAGPMGAPLASPSAVKARLTSSKARNMLSWRLRSAWAASRSRSAAATAALRRARSRKAQALTPKASPAAPAVAT